MKETKFSISSSDFSMSLPIITVNEDYDKLTIDGKLYVLNTIIDWAKKELQTNHLIDLR